MPTFITSNIRYDNPQDEAHAWHHRKDFLGQILKKHSPWLIATQEGRHPQQQELAKLLSPLHLIQGHRRWIPERMYPSLYYHPAHLTLFDSGDFWLSETPTVEGSFSFGSLFPRLCTWARLSSIHDSTIFLVANAHLDHMQESTRQRQVEVMAKCLQSVRQSSDRMVVMGDFNTGPESATRKKLIKLFPQLVDPWLQLKRPEETSHHFFQQDYAEGERIDWILYDKRFKTNSIQLDKSSSAGLWPSDHYPVICHFE